MNVEIELENCNVQWEGREKDEYIYRFNSSVGGGKTTINFTRITKEKEEDICSQYLDFP